MSGETQGTAEHSERRVLLRWSFRETYEATVSERTFASLLPPDIDPDDQEAAWAWLERNPAALADYVESYPKSWLSRDEGSLELHTMLGKSAEKRPS